MLSIYSVFIDKFITMLYKPLILSRRAKQAAPTITTFFQMIVSNEMKHEAGMNRRRFILKCGLALGCFLTCGRGTASAWNGITALWGPARRPQIALIIDDIGQNGKRAREFMDIDIALTFSILPHLPYSRELAGELNRVGYEVMLHQPMEPYSRTQDPGPGALYVGDGPERIADVMESNLHNIPYAVGVNNHMGSKFTESGDDLGNALKIVKMKEMFFVDSWTSRHSKAHAISRSFGIPTLSRRIFLDNVREESAVMAELHRLKECALRNGQAVGIGHPLTCTARAINRFARDRRNADIELVSVSALL